MTDKSILNPPADPDPIRRIHSHLSYLAERMNNKCEAMVRHSLEKGFKRLSRIDSGCVVTFPLIRSMLVAIAKSFDNRIVRQS
ncbi:MAG: hypothetical protein ACRESZ_15590 [Methylococcales bacterium]